MYKKNELLILHVSLIDQNHLACVCMCLKLQLLLIDVIKAVITNTALLVHVRVKPTQALTVQCSNVSQVCLKYV